MGCCMSTSGECFGFANQIEQRDWRSRKKAALAAEAKHDEQLRLFPGRIWRNGASNVASLYTERGEKGINQDAMLLWHEFGLRKNTIFCGVFDGHGPYGHLVAERVRDSLPSKLLSHFETIVLSKSDKKTQISKSKCGLERSTSAENEILDMFPYLKDAHLQACKSMDKELKVHPIIDCFCSGSTAVTILKQGRHLCLANIGDSRAVMATKADDNSVIAVQLTVDLKPNLPEEAERIRQCQGRVFALNDEPDVHRVWLPNFKSPGLAMARAFGDFCLKDFGVIAVPEISYRHISDKDLFIILATDGVWDVLSNQEAVDIIYSAPSRRTAAKDLVTCAVQAWNRKYPASKVDDCAVVCLYLDEFDLHIHKINLTSKDNFQYSKQTSPSSDNTIPDSSESVAIHTFIDKSQTETIYTESLLDGDSSNGEEWSALEGVTRVNSLLNLPRFDPGVKIGSTSKRKY